MITLLGVSLWLPVVHLRSTYIWCCYVKSFPSDAAQFRVCCNYITRNIKDRNTGLCGSAHTNKTIAFIARTVCMTMKFAWCVQLPRAPTRICMLYIQYSAQRQSQVGTIAPQLRQGQAVAVVVRTTQAPRRWKRTWTRSRQQLPWICERRKAQRKISRERKKVTAVFACRRVSPFLSFRLCVMWGFDDLQWSSSTKLQTDGQSCHRCYLACLKFPKEELWRFLWTFFCGQISKIGLRVAFEQQRRSQTIRQTSRQCSRTQGELIQWLLLDWPFSGNLNFIL